jgi:tetratricopeptide (TPR) repeat protein
MKTPDTPKKNGEEDEFIAIIQEYTEAVNGRNIEEQEAVMLKVFQHLSDNQDDEPDPWLQALAEAHRCEAAFDWPRAEEAFKRAVEVSADQPALRSKALSHLSAFYDLIGLDVLSDEAQEESNQVARRSEMPVLHHVALMSEARIHLKAKNLDSAFAALAEASAGLQKGPRHDLQRAHTAILRAQCHLEDGAFDKAEADLSSVRGELETHSEAFLLAGWQSALASYWATTARLREQRGDLPGGVCAWREVVERRQIIASCPQLEGPYKYNWLARSLQCLGKALRQVEDDEATEMFEESSSIRRAIGLPALEG